jgi:HAD superfamily hydrolase (TIGR01509 family)
MAPEVDAILLDLGNVLVFHDDALLYQRLASSGSRSADEVRMALREVWDPCNRGRLAGETLRQAVGKAAGAEFDPASFPDLWSSHFRFHAEVLPLVESLLGRVKVLLLSNTNATHLDWIRPRLPILERFDGLVLSYQLGLAKPEPAIFAEALRLAGTAPARTAFFDDIEIYVQAARTLGLRGHVFTDAASFQRQLAKLGL